MPDHSRKRDPTRKRRGERSRSTANDEHCLYGLHAVRAALANQERRPKRLLVAGSLPPDLLELAETRGIRPESVDRRALDTMTQGGVHQGMVLEVPPLPEPLLESVCSAATRLVVLDQVTDPHNVGAILRSAAVFGVEGVIMTARNSPPASGVLAKAASGALDHVPIVRVSNLARALGELQDRGFLVVGLDGEAEAEIGSVAAETRLALVMGAEGKGLRRLTRERCDLLARIPATGEMRSLNVSTAASVALYAVRHG